MMEAKCPKCGKVFSIGKDAEWLVKRARENKLDSISIKCEKCERYFDIEPLSLSVIEKKEAILTQGTCPKCRSINIQLIEKDSELTYNRICLQCGTKWHTDKRSNKFRYRVEQVVLTKFNGQIISHGTTKQEYTIEKKMANGILNSVDVELIENVIQFNPSQLETSVSMLCDVDIVKSDVSIIPNTSSGKVQEIKDKSRVLARWEKYKKETVQQFKFLKAAKTKEDVDLFLDTVEQQIHNDQSLIGDYQSKIFFDIIFDKYLVSKEDYKPFSKYCLSNLFDHKLLSLNVGQFIVQEAPDFIKVKQIGTINKADMNKHELVEVYDQKFKPYIGFSFTEYEYKYLSDYVLDTVDEVIREANIVIIEEVKNNVQITINYELKRVDL